MAEKTVAVNEQKKPENVREELTYENILAFVDKNIRTVQLGIYSVAFCGLVIVVRSFRPFKKFIYPSDIPKSFFKQHVQLTGNVMRIDFSPRPVLLVDHNPLYFSRFRKPGQGLKVGLEGIDLMPNGISWLQTIVVGQQIKFTLMSSQPDYVLSMVEYNSKDIANQLVTLGFASVSTYNQNLDTDKKYRNYYKSLLKQESRAESKRLGMWSEGPFNLFKYILSKLLSNFDRLKPKSLKL